MKVKVHSKTQHGAAGTRSIAAWCVSALICEVFVAKSLLIQVIPESVMLYAHYGISTALVTTGTLDTLSRRADPIPSEFRPAFWVTVAIAFWLLITVPFRNDATMEFVGASAFACLALMAFRIVPASLRSDADLRAIVRPLVVLGNIVVYASLALLIATGIGFDESHRFRGITGNSAVSSGVFYCTSVLFFSLWLRNTHNRRHLLSFMLSLVCLYLTYTRSVIFPFVLFAGFVLWRSMASTVVATTKAIAFTGALLVGVVIYVANDDLRFSVNESLRFQSKTWDSRGTNWAVGMKRIEESPIVGLGLLSRHDLGGADLRTQLESGIVGYNQRHDPHNVLLYATQVGGPVLGLLVLALIPATGFPAIQRIRLSIVRRDPIGIFVGGYLVLYLATTLTSPAFLTLGNFLDRMFWIVLGGAIALRQKDLRAVRWRRTMTMPAGPGDIRRSNAKDQLWRRHPQPVMGGDS